MAAEFPWIIICFMEIETKDQHGCKGCKSDTSDHTPLQERFIENAPRIWGYKRANKAHQGHPEKFAEVE